MPFTHTPTSQSRERTFVTSNHLAHYRVGAELARYVRSQTGQGVPPVTALQAVVADIAATTPNLAIPLRDLVSRQGFQVLLPLAGSGSGELQCKALVDDIRQLYHPDVVQMIVEVLSGFLECGGEKMAQVEKPVDVIKTPLVKPVRAELPPKVVEEQSRKYATHRRDVVRRPSRIIADILGANIAIMLLLVIPRLSKEPSPGLIVGIAVVGLLTTLVFTVR